MTRSAELSDLAETLAYDLQLNGHDVNGADILDGLASTGMMLVEDADGTAAEAYRKQVCSEP